MDLETEARPRFLNHEGSRAWFLTDLENGTVVKMARLFSCPKQLSLKITFIV